MSLAELQSAFQGAILNADVPIPGAILASRQQSAAERFAIYQDAYRLRLTEFLATDYPVLRVVMGDDDFAGLAEAYIAATPSSFRNARWYGRGLPAFMRDHAPWQEISAFVDLARFECALNDAFDAADCDALDATALAAVAAQDQPRLQFSFQPSLFVLTLAQGIAAAHEAMINELEASPPSGSEEETVLIWRDPSQQAFYRVLGEDESLALGAAKAGANFAEICGLLSLRLPEEEAANQAAVFLIRWFADGLITGCTSD